MNCDYCQYYNWYYDWCNKWQCEVDARSVYNCFEKYATPIRDEMVGKDDNSLQIKNFKLKTRRGE